MAKSVFPVGMTVWLFCAIPAAIAAPDAIRRTTFSETATIRVAAEQAYPPYSFVGEDGQATGFSVDLARAIAETMGLTVEIKIAPWGQIRDDLTEGKLDLIAGMYYSDERSRTVAFSPPYTVTHHAIFARKQSPPVASEADLRGKSLIVMRGDIMHDYVVANGLSDRRRRDPDPGGRLALACVGEGMTTPCWRGCRGCTSSSSSACPTS